MLGDDQRLNNIKHKNFQNKNKKNYQQQKNKTTASIKTKERNKSLLILDRKKNC
jgi:hypothetical protein